MLAKVEAEAPVIEAVTPQAAVVEDAAFYCLGAIGQAMDAVAASVQSGGLNVNLDIDAWARIKAAIDVVKHPSVVATAAK